MNNKKPVQWQNILNYKHAPMFSFDLGAFCKQARTLGYPYFNWNDRIYDTDDGHFTGYVVEEEDHIRFVNETDTIGFGAPLQADPNRDTTQFAEKIFIDGELTPDPTIWDYPTAPIFARPQLKSDIDESSTPDEEEENND